ncbi:MAG TPA: Flp family type IVb pilin [Candidatus Angelobacter sp.]|jgi:pilus assembly protein Flp/PilA|nr:Flp family type IVb pilin [Candidatus Angelobacter sp.]
MFSKLQDSALKLYVASQTLISDEKGQDLIEYAILCALVAVVAVAATGNLKTIISNIFSSMGSNVTSSMAKVS